MSRTLHAAVNSINSKIIIKIKKIFRKILFITIFNALYNIYLVLQVPQKYYFLLIKSQKNYYFLTFLKHIFDNRNFYGEKYFFYKCK